MSVKSFTQPDSTVQSAASYPGILDAAASVFMRLADNFAPHAQTVPDFTVALDPGHVMSGQTPVEQGAQSTGTISMPVTNPRIDRIVIDDSTGAVSVVTGTEAASPVPPAIPVGKSPVAQVLLQTTSTAITNAMLADERDFSNVGLAGGALINVQIFTSSGTYTPTAGTSKVIVEVQAGGGSGGGTAATSATTGAASSGGASGAYAKSLFTSGFAGVAVAVGAGGAAPAAGANNGNLGGASSFGSLVSCAGGGRGNAGPAFTPPALVGGAGAGAGPTGANIVGGTGVQSAAGFVLGTTVVVGGSGGPSHFGGGGTGGGNSVGGNAASPGAGGGGSSSIASTAARSGGAGANGIVIVYEYA